MSDSKLFSEILEKLLNESADLNNHSIHSIFYLMANIGDHIAGSKMNNYNSENLTLINLAIKVLEKYEQLEITEEQVEFIGFYKHAFDKYRESFTEQPTDSMVKKKNRRPRCNDDLNIYSAVKRRQCRDSSALQGH